MLEILTNIGIVAGALVGLGIIWSKGFLPLYHFLRKMEQVHDIILEFPDWKSGVDENLQQLCPNHGTSVKDRVDETARVMAQVKDMLETHINDPGAHS